MGVVYCTYYILYIGILLMKGNWLLIIIIVTINSYGFCYIVELYTGNSYWFQNKRN